MEVRSPPAAHATSTRALTSSHAADAAGAPSAAASPGDELAGDAAREDEGGAGERRGAVSRFCMGMF